MQTNNDINTTNSAYTRIDSLTNLQIGPAQAKNSIRGLVADIKNNLNELYESQNLLELSGKIRLISENKKQYYDSKFLGFLIKFFSKICNFKLHGEFKTSAQICAELADQMGAEARRRASLTVSEERVSVEDPSSNPHTDAMPNATQQASLEHEDRIIEEDSIESDESEDDTVYYEMKEPSSEELEQLGIKPLVNLNQGQEIEDSDDETDSIDDTDSDEFFDIPPLTPEECERYGISPDNPFPIPNNNKMNPDSPMVCETDSSQEEKELIDEQTENNEMDLQRDPSEDDVPQEIAISATVHSNTPVENSTLREDPPKSLKSTIIENLNSGIAEADPTLGAWCTVIFHQIFSSVDITDWRRNGENDYTITLSQEMVGHTPQLPGAGILNREFRVQFSTIEIDGEACPVINLPNGGIAQRTGSGWLSFDTHVYSMTVIPGRADIPNVRIATRLISRDVPANLVSDIWMDVEWNQ
jgi:hypothetical protein